MGYRPGPALLYHSPRWVRTLRIKSGPSMTAITPAVPVKRSPRGVLMTPPPAPATTAPPHTYIHFEGQNPAHPSEHMREISSYELKQMNR
jgi:hypothetical protein